MTAEAKKIINAFQGVKILCIGDIMLDRYAYGSVSRTAPEGNAPVLYIHKENLMLGGAGNTMANAASLGAYVTAFALIGDDATGETITKIMQESGIDTSHLYKDEDRPTISKSRYTNEATHIVRVDYEDTSEPIDSIQKEIIKKIEALIEHQDAVILSDYKKGMVTKRVTTAIITCAKKHNVPVFIDSKETDYTKFMGATLIKPNKAELAAASGLPCKEETELDEAATFIIKSASLNALLLTRSEDGVSLYEAEGAKTSYPAKVSKVRQVAGAGDTVIATLAVACAAGADLKTATMLANMAANVIVEEDDTTLITPKKLLNKLNA